MGSVPDGGLMAEKVEEYGLQGVSPKIVGTVRRQSTNYQLDQDQEVLVNVE